MANKARVVAVFLVGTGPDPMQWTGWLSGQRIGISLLSVAPFSGR